MYRYKKVLVHLELQDDERHLIKMAAKITQLAKSEHIIFSHVSEKIDIPAPVKEKYPWLLEPLDQTMQNRINEHLELNYQGYAETQVDVRVEEGQPVYRLLEIAQKEEVDLIIVGKKLDDSQLAVRLARKAPCSVCVVPPGANADFKKILVPIDFSKYSKNGIDVASAFGEAQELNELNFLHVALIPRTRGQAVLSEKQLKDMNEKHYNSLLSEYAESNDTRGLQVIPATEHGHSIAPSISKHASSSDSDLIIISARGKDAFSALLLGSNAEELMQIASVPVVAVKEKGTGKSFLDNLLGSVS